DWQPSDEGSFYNDGSTIWNQNYHRIGVYWRDPWHLEYYVDGQLVRTRSGKDQIDPVYFTNATDPGNAAMDTRTGLSKPMDIIINAEDQTWRAAQGLTPTDAELANEQNNTFKVDWIRVYKPTAAPKPSGGFGVFPNPANTRLQVKGEALNEDFQLEIINQVGAVVAVNHYQDQSQTIEFDISQLVPGYYSLRLITGSEIYQSRFVKE
ncbi:MAG: T9SS type A sorting domain-containing protein, partial [Bacteroidota bacterium]